MLEAAELILLVLLINEVLLSDVLSDFFSALMCHHIVYILYPHAGTNKSQGKTMSERSERGLGPVLILFS